MTTRTDRRHALHQALALGLLLAAGPRRVAADEGWLVTPAEVAALSAQPAPPLWLTRMAGAPQIEVIQPHLEGGTVASPLPIELAFRPAADAAIDVDSFRIFYGALQLDITRRLLKTVTVRPDGLKVERAAIPTGSHRLVLQIADDRRRQATRELRFTVG